MIQSWSIGTPQGTPNISGIYRRSWQVYSHSSNSFPIVNLQPPKCNQAFKVREIGRRVLFEQIANRFKRRVIGLPQHPCDIGNILDASGLEFHEHQVWEWLYSLC